ncbi:hypothetical protein [Robertkochia flava]|uniref:hypothetical protein n=1 Tax=Robertkochia flava TaxID=3447986 RepID=UPI001CC8F572|nr:hypothetical protein [Robertkochia marina]
MAKHIYSSFEEIDLQLEILKTEAQLEKARVTQQYNEARQQMSFFSILGSATSFLAKKAVIAKIISKIFK